MGRLTRFLFIKNKETRRKWEGTFISWIQNIIESYLDSCVRCERWRGNWSVSAAQSPNSTTFRDVNRSNTDKLNESQLETFNKDNTRNDGATGSKFISGNEMPTSSSPDLIRSSSNSCLLVSPSDSILSNSDLKESLNHLRYEQVELHTHIVLSHNSFWSLHYFSIFTFKKGYWLIVIVAIC